MGLLWDSLGNGGKVLLIAKVGLTDGQKVLILIGI